jgi:hypothetical protein
MLIAAIGARPSPGLAQSHAPQEHPAAPESHPAAPPEDPELDDAQLTDDAKTLESQQHGDTRVSPSAERAGAPAQPGLPGPLEALPGLEGTDHLLRAPAIRSEGVFLTLRRGTVVKGKGGEWWFVFHRDAEGRAERPMILLPSLALERMVAAAEETERPVFRATGQVFVYYGRNYLLPVTAVLAPAVEAAPAPDAQAKPTEPGAEPSVEDLIRELTERGSEPRALSGQTGGAGAGAAAGGAEVVAEGKLIARRRGRMIRDSAAWAFVFDNDSDTASAGAGDRPMILVPSLNLETMEKIAARQGDAVIFELSGRVLEYRGRNYLIPTMFQVVRDREVRPLQ